MNYYFENYVDAGALYAFLDRLGLVAMETDGSAGYAVLNAFGLVVNSSDKAYEVGLEYLICWEHLSSSLG